jgi:hypothetical protein
MSFWKSPLPVEIRLLLKTCLMNQTAHTFFVILAIAALVEKASGQTFLPTPSDFNGPSVKVSNVQHKGKKGVKLATSPDGDPVAILNGVDFRNGTIEVELAGIPGPRADSTNRGFVGMAFRIQKGDTLSYETIYLRPTNGRSTDQLRRNHTAQYASHPGYEWFKLRKENPGLYESYVDMVPGEWTKVKIVVKDKQAKLYVHGSDQPCLIVNDLKKGTRSGSIGLWAGVDVDGYFRNLKVTKAN